MKKTWILIILIPIVGIGGYLVGNATTSKKIDGYSYDLKKVQNEKKSTEEQLTGLRKDVDTKRNDLEGITKDFEEAKAIVADKEKNQKESLALKKEVETLTSDIASKKEEQEKLENIVIKLKEEPRKLPAGKFIVGEDIDEGRYKVTPLEGKQGNYFVNDGMDANVILGNDSYSTEEYITTLKNKDKIDQSLPVQYEKVK
ncbi:MULTISPECIES: hypothetical protein [Vagococcus]|uniref:hypothetical protein n=1 Tax=Vagococcus TaxID=2737 RepID=UPI0037B23A23